MGKCKVDSLSFFINGTSIRADVELELYKFGDYGRLPASFVLDTGANDTCISINSLMELGYTEEYLKERFKYSSHDYIVGCTSDKVEAFRLNIGDIFFNGFTLRNFSVMVINPNEYISINRSIDEENDRIVSYAKESNDVGFYKKYYRPAYDLPNILGLDILKYFNIDLECPHFNRKTGVYKEYGGHLYIRLGSNYYEEFPYESIYFESTFNPVYVDDSIDNIYPSDRINPIKFGD